MVKSSAYVTDIGNSLALYAAGARRCGTGDTQAIRAGRKNKARDGRRKGRARNCLNTPRPLQWKIRRGRSCSRLADAVYFALAAFPATKSQFTKWSRKAWTKSGRRF